MFFVNSDRIVIVTVITPQMYESHALVAFWKMVCLRGRQTGGFASMEGTTAPQHTKLGCELRWKTHLGLKLMSENRNGICCLYVENSDIFYDCA